MHKCVLPTHGLEFPVSLAPRPGAFAFKHLEYRLLGKPGEMGKGKRRGDLPPSCPFFDSSGLRGPICLAGGFHGCSLGTNGWPWGGGEVLRPVAYSDQVGEFQGSFPLCALLPQFSKEGLECSFAGLVRSFSMILYLVS